MTEALAEEATVAAARVVVVKVEVAAGVVREASRAGTAGTAGLVASVGTPEVQVEVAMVAPAEVVVPTVEVAEPGTGHRLHSSRLAHGTRYCGSMD